MNPGLPLKLILNESMALTISDPTGKVTDNRKGKILRIPTRQDIAAPFNEQLVIELYSK